MKTWQIDYTVRDGLNKYPGRLFLRAERLDRAAAAAAAADCWPLPEGGQREEFIKELLKDDFALLPGKERAVSDLHWSPAPVIRVRLEGGRVSEVSGIPAGISVAVEDPEAAVTDASGAPVAVVIVWAGPLWPTP